MSEIWFTSDLHLGHNNIIGFCDRPFNSVAHMNEELIARINSVVHPDDTLFILGDFAMGTISETLPLADRINGRKILVVGNHDRPFEGPVDKVKRWTEEYSRYFELIWAHYLPGYASLFEEFDLAHFPRFENGPRYASLRPTPSGHWLLHGHTHVGPARRIDWDWQMFNVGVDANNFYPVHIDTIRDLIAQGR